MKKCRVLGSGLAVLLAALLGGCETEVRPEPSWAVVAQSRREALLALSGRSRSEVWAVGADRGRGPLVLRYDGVSWQELPTGQRGDLWAVHAIEQGPVMMAGANATILRYEEGVQGGHFTRMRTPGLARHTVYGLWGSRADDVYAVGTAPGRGGFVWHYDGAQWSEAPVDFQGLSRAASGELPAFFGVWGNGQGDVFVVGDRGAVLRSRGGAGFTPLDAGTQERLVSVHGAGATVAIAGGSSQGVLVELSPPYEQRSEVALQNASGLLSVTLAADGTGWATGQRGELYRRTGPGAWEKADHGLQLDAQGLQASWVDPQGGVWLAGGNVLSSSLSNGVLLQRGAQVPEVPLSLIAETPVASCPEPQVDPVPTGSIARRWDEQLLGAIRRDIPRPTVHARNLFHVSAAMWDAWASYDAAADGVFVREKHTAQDVASARVEAISYAAYRVLLHRYAEATGGATTKACLGAFMLKLGYDTEATGTEGDSPRALGNRVGQALINFGLTDGANEQADYKDTTGFRASNPPLVVETPGVVVLNPSLWQPLNLAVSVTQNGIDTAAGVQGYIGAHWGRVTPFAMVRASSGELYLDPGPAPTFGPALRGNAVEVLRKSSWLGSSEPVDISPGAVGNNPLGTNDGKGHGLNPVTGQPYAPNVVKRGDFGRVLAEFWADGPKSETPPGHWNVIANQVADSPGFARRLFGTGAPVDALEWDVKVYLALNGAVHDAAIAAWEIKRASTTARPITLLRYMGTLGQSSQPAAPLYHPDGLPLVPGLIEPITAESSARGGPHEHLAPFVGQLAVHAWRGEPGDRVHEASGSGWILASEWMPYQLRTFVTPAFPGFISGHSTFSRASAEVLAALTGSAYFPGGLAQYVAAPGTTLTFEQGPSTEVRLQWATYFDAADQAGQSRLWGGIHVEPDDLVGRKLGRQAGLGALERASRFFDGSAIP